MAEVYPSDSELNNLISESETGVEYIPTGTAPYYTHFRKLLYRLLLATKRANDLRLYDEGGLTFGVKAGKFFNGNTLVSYAGSSGNVLADNKSSIYVYIDSSGTLFFTDYVMFPSMGLSKHVRLAVISTSNGDITSIEDYRDQHSIAMPQRDNVVYEAHIADTQLEHGETGSVHTNLGATGTVTISLPTYIVAGTKYTFAIQATQEFRIDPLSGAIIDDCGVTASKYKYCGTVGSCLTIVSDGMGNWVTVGKTGTWTEEV